MPVSFQARARTLNIPNLDRPKPSLTSFFLSIVLVAVPPEYLDGLPLLEPSVADLAPEHPYPGGPVSIDGGDPVHPYTGEPVSLLLPDSPQEDWRRAEETQDVVGGHTSSKETKNVLLFSLQRHEVCCLII